MGHDVQILKPLHITNLELPKRGRRMQAAAMDEAPNPDIPDFFKNKIPAG
jgi:hypothetical protein